MRIVQLLASTEPSGGLERHCRDLASGLSVRGHQVTVICHPPVAAALPAHVGRVALPMDRWRWSPAALARLAVAVRRLSPDILHAHGSKAVRMAVTLRPFLPRCAVVATAHGIKRSYRAYGRADGVIAVSETVRSRIRHRRCVRIYNGVPLPGGPARREELGAVAGADGGRPIVVAAGRLVPVKGFDILIEAWDPAWEARLVIFGEGPEADRLRALADRRGLARSIRLAGYSHHLPRLLAAADLVVIPSRREGFSYVLAEALCAGTPVVSARVPIASEILPEAALCPPGDPAALRQRIGEALADPARFRERLEPAVSFARAHLTVERMVDGTLAFYASLLDRS